MVHQLYLIVADHPIAAFILATLAAFYGLWCLFQAVRVGQEYLAEQEMLTRAWDKYTRGLL